MKNNFIRFPLVVLALISAAACGGKEIDESNPQDLYKDAEEDIAGDHYLIALDKLKSIKNKFPYSSVATQAKLRIADVYFLQESFIEAAGAYESFRDMHPKHEKADYVLFRIGESYFRQLPDSNDRDLSPATRAIEAYQELLGLYPKSQYAEEARQKLRLTGERLADKERYIADFYFKREMFDSAAGRYEKIAKMFAGTTIEQYGYWRWAESLMRQNKNDEAKHVLKTYLSRFPRGDYSDRANQAIQNTETKKGA